MSLNREELRERVEAARILDLPRASLGLLGDRLDGAEAFTEPAVRDAIDEHLSHFVWLIRNDEMACPGCTIGRGWFAWGLVHGCGFCTMCGWPGQLYHYISDLRPTALCRYCGKPLDEHAPEKKRIWTLADGTTERVELFRACINGRQWDEYKPADLAKINFLLWAHPDDVKVRD